ncbi:hypothetical protein PENSOL_c014G06529 [Penicillium solitum]|uniref:Uncharacterized protein n=1 Tax=Penicillium solitum TaxID=60172 RepID=A0A1V6R6V4_9EURO|nr:uncharacterized protein PENSOL_c014G06529 [Penicillium solitum]OQD96896.1 hypothetical protein PENSOL_c014G06529 [Penicillium solitum]
MVPNPAGRAIGQLPEQPKIDRVSVLFRFRDRPITIPDLTTLVSQDSSFKARNELVAVSIKARMNPEKADTISTTRYNSPSNSSNGHDIGGLVGNLAAAVSSFISTDSDTSEQLRLPTLWDRNRPIGVHLSLVGLMFKRDQKWSLEGRRKDAGKHHLIEN